MDDIVETIMPGGWGLAIGVGLGVALLAGRGLRPLAKTAIKGAMAATDGVQRMTAGAREGLQDLVAEARSEREASAKPQVTEIVTSSS